MTRRRRAQQQPLPVDEHFRDTDACVSSLLAQDLLELGQTEAVLSYFELCRVFWKIGGSRLDAWASEVKAGKVPNFGANLRY